jgi:hypothetical protein
MAGSRHIAWRQRGSLSSCGDAGCKSHLRCHRHQYAHARRFSSEATATTSRKIRACGVGGTGKNVWAYLNDRNF